MTSLHRCLRLSLLLLLFFLSSLTPSASPPAQSAGLPLLALSPSSSVDWPLLASDLRSMLTAPPSPGETDAHRGPAFILLAWHSSASFSAHEGRGGTDGAGIRFPPERGWPANGSVGPALRLLEQLQRRHPNVSLADLVALSAVVAIHDLRGPAIPFQLGRADLPPHPLPLSTPSRIPIGNSSLPTLLRTFRALGLSAQEMVALIGAHSLGRCHVERSGYEGRWSRRPGVFSADVFRAMRGERWSRRQWAGPMQWQNEDGALMMLPSDLALMEGEETRSWVLKYADDEPLFFTHFQAAFTKLIELGVQRHRTHAGGGG